MEAYGPWLTSPVHARNEIITTALARPVPSFPGELNRLPAERREQLFGRDPTGKRHSSLPTFSFFSGQVPLSTSIQTLLCCPLEFRAETTFVAA